MQFKTFDVFELLKSAGTDVDALREGHNDRSPQYFAYHTHAGDEVIEVESTAREAMANITRLPHDVQVMIFVAIVRILPRPGEQTILTDDGKKRGARVVRLASPEDQPDVRRLLLTH